VTTVCSKDGDAYRFGFNGQMKTNEWAGTGNHNTAQFWEYDTRTGRRFNLDPVDQISKSNYAVLALSPISHIDPLGNNEDNIEVDDKEKTYRVTKTDDPYDVVTERKYDQNGNSIPIVKSDNGKTPNHYQKGSYQNYLKGKGYNERAPLRGAQSEEFAVEMAALDGLGKLVGKGIRWAWGATFGKAAIETARAEGAVWAQKTFSSTFSEEGSLAGKTVDEVAASLKSGKMAAKDLPIDLIKRGDETFILNTRSSAALERAGIPRSEWNVVDRTGQAGYESRLTEQLTKNNLPNGTTIIRESGTKNTIGN